MIALIQVLVTVLCVFFIGLIIKTPIESLIICFTVSILRKYSGGAHAGSIFKCTLIAVFYCTVFAFIGKHLLSDVFKWQGMLAILVPVFSGAFYVVYKAAPVDSPNKPIKSSAKRTKMRRGAFIVLVIYLVISLAFVPLGSKNVVYRSLCLSILFGVLWQVFTLTKVGSNLLIKVERATISKERRLEQ